MRASIGHVAYLLFPFIIMAVLIARAAKARPPMNQKDAVTRYAAARSAVAAVLVIAWAGTLLASVLANSYYFESTFTASVFLLVLSIFHSWIWDRVQPGPPGWKDVVADWARPLPDLPSSLSVSATSAPDGTACSDCDLWNRFCRHHSPCRTPTRVQRGATTPCTFTA